MKLFRRILNSLGLGNQETRAKFWQFIRNEDPAAGEPEADLLLYGEISDFSQWGDEVTLKQFADDLVSMGDVSHIRVRINSPGGDVFAAQAIYNLLQKA